MRVVNSAVNEVANVRPQNRTHADETPAERAGGILRNVPGRTRETSWMNGTEEGTDLVENDSMPNHSRHTTGARPKRPPYASPSLFSADRRELVR